ncbi:MAG: hypothetical protein NXH91_06545 [Phyllobacteriaceae bacterium]|nr:hypothetical protein [Phyllobacteriaceae bacterium]
MRFFGIFVSVFLVIGGVLYAENRIYRYNADGYYFNFLIGDEWDQLGAYQITKMDSDRFYTAIILGMDRKIAVVIGFARSGRQFENEGDFYLASDNFLKGMEVKTGQSIRVNERVSGNVEAILSDERSSYNHFHIRKYSDNGLMVFQMEIPLDVTQEENEKYQMAFRDLVAGATRAN